MRGGLLLLAESRPLGWLALAYLLMSGGEQTALGDYAWVLNRGLPTVGVLVLLVLALRSRWDPLLRERAVAAAP